MDENEYGYLTSPSNFAGMDARGQNALDNWKKSTLARIKPKDEFTAEVGGLAGSDYKSYLSNTGTKGSYTSWNDENPSDYADGILPGTSLGGTEGSTSWWGDFKSALGGDANFGKNLLGIGQLGLGLAQYLDMKPMLEKQGRLLDQQIANNRVEMAATHDTREALAQRV
jgi:hypothetical protein